MQENDMRDRHLLDLCVPAAAQELNVCVNITSST